jgi:toxic protein SymE
MQELAIGKPYRHLKVGYFRKRHEDRNTKIPKRYSVHAALSLKGDWLEKAGLPPIPGQGGRGAWKNCHRANVGRCLVKRRHFSAPDLFSCDNRRNKRPLSPSKRFIFKEMDIITP